MVVHHLPVSADVSNEHGRIIFCHAHDTFMDGNRFLSTLSYVAGDDDCYDDAISSTAHLNFCYGQQAKKRTTKSFCSWHLPVSRLPGLLDFFLFTRNDTAMGITTNFMAEPHDDHHK